MMTTTLLALLPLGGMISLFVCGALKGHTQSRLASFQRAGLDNCGNVRR